jgi:uncharacterized protein (UPF0303 family)
VATESLNELIAELEQQEQELQFTRFDNDDAWRLGLLVRDIARQRQLPVAIDVRRHGHLLFHTALDGTSPDNDSWIERKVRVTDRFHAASYLVKLRMEAGGRTFDEAEGIDPLQYAAAGGAFPIRIRGVGVVGTLTVSGLPQAEDHALVVEAIRTFLTG